MGKFELSNRQKEIITGLMLGDGCIHHGSKYSKTPRLTMSRSIIDKEYMFWLFNELKIIYNNKPYEYEVLDKRNNKAYKSIRLNSKSCSELQEFRDKWYSQNKHIPKNLEFTPLILLIWFLDDGSFRINRNSLELKLATHGFSESDNIFLAEKLSKRYKSIFRVASDKGKYYIITSSKGSASYINEIKDIYPKCMLRKNKWGNINLNIFLNDGNIVKKARINYLISNYIIENKVSTFRLNDFDNLSLVSSYLRKLVNNGSLSSTKVCSRNKSGIYIEYKVENINVFSDLLNKSSKILKIIGEI